MNRSGSQKVLRVLSILSIIGAIIALLASILSFAGGGFVGSLSPEQAASLTTETGVTQENATVMLLGLGFGGIISAIIGFIEGILGLRASNDATKIGPVLILTVISVVLGVVGILLDMTVGGQQLSQQSSDFISLFVNCFMLWICNNIKRQANA